MKENRKLTEKIGVHWKGRRRKLATEEEEKRTNGTRSGPMQATAKAVAPWAVRRQWNWQNGIPHRNKALYQSEEYADK